MAPEISFIFSIRIKLSLSNLAFSTDKCFVASNCVFSNIWFTSNNFLAFSILLSNSFWSIAIFSIDLSYSCFLALLENNSWVLLKSFKDSIKSPITCEAPAYWVESNWAWPATPEIFFTVSLSVKSTPFKSLTPISFNIACNIADLCNAISPVDFTDSIRLPCSFDEICCLPKFWKFPLEISFNMLSLKNFAEFSDCKETSLKSLVKFSSRDFWKLFLSFCWFNLNSSAVICCLDIWSLYFLSAANCVKLNLFDPSGKELITKLSIESEKLVTNWFTLFCILFFWELSSKAIAASTAEIWIACSIFPKIAEKPSKADFLIFELTVLDTSILLKVCSEDPINEPLLPNKRSKNLSSCCWNSSLAESNSGKNSVTNFVAASFWSLTIVSVSSSYIPLLVKYSFWSTFSESFL